MTNCKSVSVIIPTYNYAQFLPSCIKSVINQRGVNTEVIVIDDGSDDATPEVLRTFGDQLKVISQSNRGLSAARNSGIQHAAGDYFLFLDSDDLLAEDSIESRVRTLEQNPNCEIVVCKNLTFSRQTPSGAPIPNGLWPTFRRNYDLHLCHSNVAPPHAFLMSREVVEVVGTFDESLTACEDYDFWIRTMCHGFVPRFSPGKVHYRRHSASMSANKRNQYRHDVILHHRVYDRLLNKEKRSGALAEEKELAFVSGLLRTMLRLAKIEPAAEEIKELGIIYSDSRKKNPELFVEKAYKNLTPEGRYYFLLHQWLLRALHSKRKSIGLSELPPWPEESLSLWRANLVSLLCSLAPRNDSGLRWRLANLFFEQSIRRQAS